MQRYPIDPIPFAGGSILLCDGGRCVVQFNPLPESASDWEKEYTNRYLSALAALGHVAYVGEPSEFALVAEACNAD